MELIDHAGREREGEVERAVQQLFWGIMNGDVCLEVAVLYKEGTPFKARR